MRFAFLELSAGAMCDVPRFFIAQRKLHTKLQYRRVRAARAASFDLLHHLYYCFSTSQIQLGAGTQVSEPRADRGPQAGSPLGVVDATGPRGLMPLD